MITYKFNVLTRLKELGYNTNYLRKNKVLGESTIQQLRENKLVSYLNLERLCVLLDCQPGDIIQYVPPDENGPV